MICAQYRSYFETILTTEHDTRSLAFQIDDELGMASAIYIFDAFVNAAFASSPGRLPTPGLPPPPLHAVGTLAPLLESLLPFCEGYIEYHAWPADRGDMDGGTGGVWCDNSPLWFRRWLVLDRQRLLFFASRADADQAFEVECCAHLPLGAIDADGLTIHTASRSIRLRLCPGHGGGTRAGGCVWPEPPRWLLLRCDMPADFKVWSDAIATAVGATQHWRGFGRRQPQWAQLLFSRQGGVRLPRPLLIRAYDGDRDRDGDGGLSTGTTAAGSEATGAAAARRVTTLLRASAASHDPAAVAAANAGPNCNRRSSANQRQAVEYDLASLVNIERDISLTAALELASLWISPMLAVVSDALLTRLGSFADDGWRNHESFVVADNESGAAPSSSTPSA
eukprot:COSAG05_NODE_160_length_15590_cov_14.460848_17_plen_393_part_01